MDCLHVCYFLLTGSGQHVTCERSYYKLGCYQDRQWSRAMSELLISDRGKSNQGQSIDWNNWEDYLHGFVQSASEEDLLSCILSAHLKYHHLLKSVEPWKTSLESHGFYIISLWL